MLQLPPAPTDVDPLDLTVAQILQLTAQGAAPPTLRSFDWSKVPSQLHHLPVKQVVALYATVIEQDARHNKLRDYKPYPKQAEFHALGKDNREVMFFAGNRLGKSMSASMEIAYHLTGDYPDWWQGRRFAKAPEWWVASEDYELLRDVAQRLLFGSPEDIGSGSVPKNRIKKLIPRSGVAGALDTVLVKHKSGGIARCKFKSYKEGRAEFQGASVDGVWFDEEPKCEDSIGLYIEALTRTNDRRGLVLVTFTPLKGSTQLVNRFIVDKVPGTAYLTMTIYDVGHFNAKDIEGILAQYPEHEREARTMGTPKMGAGAVFGSIDPKKIEFSDLQLPSHWYRICGQDYGYTHPTVLVWMAQDRDADTYYVYDLHCASEMLPPEHFAAWKSRGEYIPVAWPHDGRKREAGTGDQLARMYRELGMNMLSEPAMLPATDENGVQRKSRSSVEAGVQLMHNAMREGRFKVAKHLTQWWDEFRVYHRHERTGKIVDKADDCISATRYAFIMLMQGFGVQQAHRRLHLPRKKYNSRYA